MKARGELGRFGADAGEIIEEEVGRGTSGRVIDWFGSETMLRRHAQKRTGTWDTCL